MLLPWLYDEVILLVSQLRFPKASILLKSCLEIDSTKTSPWGLPNRQSLTSLSGKYAFRLPAFCIRFVESTKHSSQPATRSSKRRTTA